MRTRRHRHGLVSSIAAIGLLGVAGPATARGEGLDADGPGRPGPARPLVTLLLRCPGPAAPADRASARGEAVVDRPIPDGPAAGLESDLVLDGIPDGPDARLFDIDPRVWIDHPRAADLTIALGAVSKDGQGVLKTLVIWDGPAAARGKPPAEADRVAPAGRPDFTPLLSLRGVRRRRLTVTDASPGKSGVLRRRSLACRTSRYALAHDAADDRRVLFGDGRADGPRPSPSVAGYFREVSRGRATFADAGLFGPVPWDRWDGSSDDEQCAAAVHLLEDQGFDFRRFDADRNGIIAFDELTVLVIHHDGAASDGRTRIHRGGTTLRRSPLRVNPEVVFVPQRFDFMTLTHELAHALNPSAMVDLYGTWNKEALSEGLTLMSATLGHPPDDRWSLYIDPWHRHRPGWMGLRDPGPVDHFELRPERSLDARGAHPDPMIVRRPGVPGSESYLFEYRDGSGYDDGVGDRGVVAWHVRVNLLGLPAAGGGDDVPGHAVYAVGPDAPRGARRAWKPSDGPFRLRWADGTLLPAVYRVEPAPPGRPGAVLRWSPAAEDRPAAR